jgi:putative ABC transport system permease protein
MNYLALRMLMGERAKYLGLVFAIAFSTFLLENQTSIFAGILKRTASQVVDITDADVWVMDPRTQYFEQTRALKDTDLFRVRGIPPSNGRPRLVWQNDTASSILAILWGSHSIRAAH